MNLCPGLEDAHFPITIFEHLEGSVSQNIDVGLIVYSIVCRRCYFSKDLEQNMISYPSFVVE